MVPVGGFDCSAAEESFTEAVDLAASVREELNSLAAIFAQSHESDLRDANTSHQWSYISVGLIVLGFFLQIVG